MTRAELVRKYGLWAAMSGLAALRGTLLHEPGNTVGVNLIPAVGAETGAAELTMRELNDAKRMVDPPQCTDHYIAAVQNRARLRLSSPLED